MYIYTLFPTFFQYLYQSKKFDQQLIFAFEKVSSILLLFPQHKVLFEFIYLF